MSARRGLTHREIAGCFNAGLGRRYRVRMIGGSAEPLYVPGTDGWAEIRYTRDYAASALHELAHWCLAGSARRRVADYGYWYRPPPRKPAEQTAFARVELAVQALERVLAGAAGLRFRVSMDDPDTCPEFVQRFEHAVARRSERFLEAGLPPRARSLRMALARLRETP